jgi:hypothetical protein
MDNREKAEEMPVLIVTTKSGLWKCLFEAGNGTDFIDKKKLFQKNSMRDFNHIMAIAVNQIILNRWRCKMYGEWLCLQPKS